MTDAAEVRGVRAALVEAVRARGAGAPAQDDAAVVIAELLGNVLRHAPGPARVALEWDGDRPVLTVEDAGPGFDLVHHVPGPGAESGRGLHLVAGLADHLDVARGPLGGACVRVRLTFP